MEAARDQLAAARNVTDAKQVADGAAAIRIWLKRQTEVGIAIVNHASLLKLEAESRMGEFLKQPGAVHNGMGSPKKASQPGTLSPPTHKELGISRQSGQRYEQVASVPREMLKRLADDATRRGVELTQESVLKLAQTLRPKGESRQSAGHTAQSAGHRATLDAPTVPFLGMVTTGDARELASRLPDHSISLCFCDPVYDRLEDYEWLARECERLLVPSGSLVVQCGTLRRFECEVVMRRSSLQFVDLLAEVYPFALCALWKIRVQVGWKPYLWFSHGDRAGDGWLMNRVHAKGKRGCDEAKAIHEWGDAEQFAEGLLAHLCPQGGIIWDPFTGSGTVPAVAARLGLPFIAFEIDPDVAQAARDRLSGTRRLKRSQQVLDLAEETL